MRDTQLNQKQTYDKNKKFRSFSVGEKVYVRNFLTGPKWLPGIIMDNTGPTSYRVKLDDDRVVRKHIDQMRIRYDNSELPTVVPDIVVDKPIVREIVVPEINREVDILPEPVVDNEPVNEPVVNGEPVRPEVQPELRRSTRIRREPDRLNLYVDADLPETFV